MNKQEAIEVLMTSNNVKTIKKQIKKGTNPLVVAKNFAILSGVIKRRKTL